MKKKAAKKSFTSGDANCRTSGERIGKENRRSCILRSPPAHSVRKAAGLPSG